MVNYITHHFGRINGVAVLTRVFFFTGKCMVVFARWPKQSGRNNELTVLTEVAVRWGSAVFINTTQLT